MNRIQHKTIEKGVTPCAPEWGLRFQVSFLFSK
jgi:hypothetical protein